MQEESTKETQVQNQIGYNPVRTVMLGTPSLTGQLDVWYVHSLIQTIQLCALNNIHVFPMFLSYDSLLPRARNDLVYIALDSNIDDLVFVDSDEEWNPQDFLRILSHNVDLVGGTARKKIDEEIYVARILKGETSLKINKDNGLMEVEGIGTGFTRLSRNCLNILWSNAPAYTDSAKSAKDEIKNNRRMIFNITINDEGLFTSEDISMCNLWKSTGGKVWLDYKITCNHIGTKKYVGNFENWLARQQPITNFI